MNFASSMPSARTGFENFLFQNFGVYTDISSDAAFLAVAVVGISLLFKRSTFFAG